MRLDSGGVSADDKKVHHIRLDRIAGVGDASLWWVAEAFDDGSAKPEGMFVDRAEAMSLAQELATEWGVDVVVSDGQVT